MFLPFITDGHKLLGPRDLFRVDPLLAAAEELEKRIMEGTDFRPVIDRLIRLAQPVGRGRR